MQVPIIQIFCAYTKYSNLRKYLYVKRTLYAAPLCKRLKLRLLIYRGLPGERSEICFIAGLGFRGRAMRFIARHNIYYYHIILLFHYLLYFNLEEFYEVLVGCIQV